MRHTRMCPAGVLPLCKSCPQGNCSTTPAQAVDIRESVDTLTNVSILTTGVSLHQGCEQCTYSGLISSKVLSGRRPLIHISPQATCIHHHQRHRHAWKLPFRQL